MAPNFEKSQKNKERESKENGNNNKKKEEFNSSLEALEQEFLNALDLNHLMNDLAAMKSNEPHHLLIKSENNAETGIIQEEELKQEAKKGEIKEVMKKTRVEDKGKKIDLELRLSPPKVIITKGESSNGSKSPSESNESSDQNNSSDSDGGSNVNGKRLPSLILMGCTYCYLYVMVSDDDPECPKCKRFSNLLDIFRGNPSKKAKKNYQDY